MKRAVAVGLLALAALCAFATPAAAHAELETTDPANGARFPAGEPPASVRMTFSEDVELANDSVRLFGADAAPIEGVGDPQLADGGLAITATLPDLADGAYIVSWRAVSEDAHPIDGSFSFTVGEGEAASADVVDSLQTHGNKTIGVLFGTVRGLAFAGLLVLVGAVWFLRLGWPDGGNDRGVQRLLLGAWMLVIVTAVASIFLQADYTSSSVSDVLDERYGQSMLVRLGLCAVFLVILANPARVILRGAFDAVLGLALLATLTSSGHATTGRVIPVGFVTDLVHVSAAALWLGGVTVLALLLLRSQPPAEVQEITTRFSFLAAPAIALVVLSGTVQTLRQVEDLDQLFTSAYGRLVLTKVGLLVFIVTAASVSRHIVLRWKARRRAPEGTIVAELREQPIADDDRKDLRDALVVEVALAAVILAVTAVLVNTVPPKETAETPAAAVPSPFTQTIEGDQLRFGVAVAPAATGENHVVLRLMDADGQPFTTIEATAEMSQAERGISAIDIPLTAADEEGVYEGTVELPIPGPWELKITALRTELDEEEVTTTVEIR
jgi:copper transport protein